MQFVISPKNGTSRNAFQSNDDNIKNTRNSIAGRNTHSGNTK